MNLPRAVSAYFKADEGDDANSLVQAFSNEAIVVDESARHEGIDAIRVWWLAAKRKYRHVAEPIEATTSANSVFVRAKVTGQFPTSPTVLEFVFTLENARIVKLEIH